MKIYVSEKENINLKFNKKCELVIFDSEPAIKLTEPEFCQPIKTVNLPAYSLEQHDEEIKTIARQEVIEEILKFVDKESDGTASYPVSILIDKLNEMKGE